jgi:hypothetical protein
MRTAHACCCFYVEGISNKRRRDTKIVTLHPSGVKVTMIVTLCLTFFFNVVFVSRGKSAHALLILCLFAHALLPLYSVGVSEATDKSIKHASKRKEALDCNHSLYKNYVFVTPLLLPYKNFVFVSRGKSIRQRASGKEHQLPCK